MGQQESCSPVCRFCPYVPCSIKELRHDPVGEHPKSLV